MKPRMSSNAQVFADLGNPWLSEREQEKDYGRSPRFEDPETDQFTKASKAQPKASGPKERGEAIVSDNHRKRVMRAHEMHMAILRLQGRVK